MYFHHHRREPRLVGESAQQGTKLATEQRFPYWGSISTTFLGWALAKQGQYDAGMKYLHQGIATYKHQAAACGLSYLLALLAEVYRDGGQAAKGLEVVQEALAHAARTGERFYEAELYRLRGELLLRSRGGRASAEGCFLKAIEFARTQKTKSWELRAATSLARLWDEKGERQMAHDLLAPVYAWFTEGFDTADLKDAKALLDALR